MVAIPRTDLCACLLLAALDCCFCQYPPVVVEVVVLVVVSVVPRVIDVAVVVGLVAAVAPAAVVLEEVVPHVGDKHTGIVDTYANCSYTIAERQLDSGKPQVVDSPMDTWVLHAVGIPWDNHIDVVDIEDIHMAWKGRNH